MNPLKLTLTKLNSVQETVLILQSFVSHFHCNILWNHSLLSVKNDWLLMGSYHRFRGISTFPVSVPLHTVFILTEPVI